MKKKLSLILVAMLLGVASLSARPGYSKPVDVFQPDGSTVTLLMHGDEFLSFMTTVDGYTVMKGADGYYRYAEKGADGYLTATSVIARNPEARSARDVQFLKACKKMVAPVMSEQQKELKAMASQMYAPVKAEAGGPKRSVSIWSRIDYSNFKGLVVLVNWNDRTFSTSDPQSLYQRLTNESGLTGNLDGHYPVNVTGSARDYFYANSLGMFDPTFDVVGPVTIDYSCTYAKPKSDNYTGRMVNIIKAVMNQINGSIDFNDYDLNSDGTIDMVYFIFAGYGSYVQGNNSGYIWPHANDFSGYASWYGLNYDGKKFGRYACSVEIQDNEDYASQHVWLDGIGTICHEFSHVLGLADHYDADYEENGQSNDPDAWDIMANGADFNYGLTPVGYNSFERHILGFVEPQQLTEAGSYSLDEFGTGNQAFILKTGSTDDDFYLENRQQTGWDRFLPGHGLVIWRADTSKPSVWRNNTVNNNANHNYFEVLGSFPGSGNIIDLTSESTPALKSWAGQPAELDLYDIKEQGGIVSFTAGKDVYTYVGEDFEQSELTTADATNVKGVWSYWNLANAVIASVAEEGQGEGQHVLKLLRSGTLTSAAPFTNGIRSLKFTAKTTGNQVRIAFKISTDGGASWSNYGLKSNPTTIKKNSEQEFFIQDIPANSMIQIQMTATTASAVCYIDNIVATFPDNVIPSPTTAINAVTTVNEPQDVPTYNLAGQRVSPNTKGVVIRNGRKYVNK